MKSFAASSLLALSIICPALAPAAEPMTAATTAALTAPRTFAKVELGSPRGIAVDIAGNLYVGNVDGGKIQKITPAGVVSELGGTSASMVADPNGLAVSADGTVFVADASGGAVYRIPAGGSTAAWAKAEGEAAISTPTGVAVDAAGNAYITNNAANSILKIAPDGKTTVFAGTSGTSGAVDGKGSAASFVTPRGIGIDGKGNLYVADEGNSNIRKITPDGEVTTLAGKATATGAKDGKGAEASFSAPRSITASTDGIVYVADTDNHTIRKIAPDGAVTTLAGKAGEAGATDGPAASARFSEPRGIAVDAAGNVFVADTGNNAIRQITPDGTVKTIAAAAPPAAATPKP